MSGTGKAGNKRIAVIGGGPTGLVAVKVLREYGHTVVGFEKKSAIGGLWRFEDEPQRKYCPLPDKNQPIGAAYTSLVLNTSKEMSCFSDFPFEDDTPTFWTHEAFLHYLEQYASNFNLKEHYRLNCKIVQLSRSTLPFVWSVTYEKDGEKRKETFDMVVLATGTHSHIHWPEVENEKDFQGTLIHSAQLRRDELFKDKNVMVVGGGYSGGETVTCAVNGGARNIYWSLPEKGKSYWLLDRRLHETQESKCQSWDHLLTRDSDFVNSSKYKSAISSQLQPLKQDTAGQNGGLDVFGVTDKPIITSASVVQCSLDEGITKLVPTIERYLYNGSSILLKDGSTIDNVDIVVYCTGYTKRFPFLNEIWDLKSQKRCELYHHILPTEEELQGLSFLGIPGCLTASKFPTSEIQARWLAEAWASREITSKGELFSQCELKKMRDEMERRKHSLHPLEEYNLLCDTYKYWDTLAEEAGCLPPDTKSLSSSDKALATALEYGPILPAQYRLRGKYTWEGSREHIIKVAQSLLGEEWKNKVESFSSMS